MRGLIEMSESGKRATHSYYLPNPVALWIKKQAEDWGMSESAFLASLLMEAMNKPARKVKK